MREEITATITLTIDEITDLMYACYEAKKNRGDLNGKWHDLYEMLYDRFDELELAYF